MAECGISLQLKYKIIVVAALLLLVAVLFYRFYFSNPPVSIPSSIVLPINIQSGSAINIPSTIEHASSPIPYVPNPSEPSP